MTEHPGAASPSSGPNAQVITDRTASDARTRSRWWVHLALIASVLVALVPLLLFGVNDRVTIHVVIACFFLALVIVHTLGSDGIPLARLTRQLATWDSQARQRRLAVSASVLSFLVLNVLASGIWDLANGRSIGIIGIIGISLPGHRLYLAWHRLSSLLLLLYLIVHVIRRRNRLRRSRIR